MTAGTEMPTSLIELSNVKYDSTQQQQAHPLQKSHYQFLYASTMTHCKRFFVSLAAAVAVVARLVSASPCVDGPGAIGCVGSFGSAIGGIGVVGGGIGGECGGGIPGNDCSTDIPVQPTTISPETDFLPVTNVLPQVNVLPTAFNDYSCDDGYGDDLGYGGCGGYGGYSGYGGYGAGAFGYGGGIGVIGC
ncbi:hypothetical protein EMPS_10369 [Entomortierella parvispora]|uniref:Uncharacterized protein n=1 Tax=Entomortierella parvispora TaxID=205924 RepID=A0A9P3M1H2_9FUNG|nr:hypothetical protein EMPS_10369 [Entomortierella parvispora]